MDFDPRVVKWIFSCCLGKMSEVDKLSRKKEYLKICDFVIHTLGSSLLVWILCTVLRISMFNLREQNVELTKASVCNEGRVYKPN